MTTIPCLHQIPATDLVDAKGRAIATEACGADLIGMSADIMETMVAAHPGPCGHMHDDNCRTRTVTCRNGHVTRIGIRRRCLVCGWQGKATCSCHPGAKLDAWPDLPIR